MSVAQNSAVWGYAGFLLPWQLPFALCLYFFSPVGVKGNQFHSWKYVFFSREFKQMEVRFGLEMGVAQN